MIEIKCSKAQFNRFIDALMRSGVNADGKCVLGKNEFTCHYTNGKNMNLTCTECFRKSIVRKKGESPLKQNKRTNELTDNEIITIEKNLKFGGNYAVILDLIIQKNDEIAKLTEIIAEQKAEIERYLHSIRLLEQDVKAAREELKEFKTMTVDEVAKMGIKAFAERMEKMISISAAQKPYFDNLVKEMTAQDK